MSSEIGPSTREDRVGRAPAPETDPADPVPAPETDPADRVRVPETGPADPAPVPEIVPVDPERALELVNRAVAQVPQQFSYLDTRGHIHMLLGDYHKAIVDLEQARSGMPENESILEALVECYQKIGMSSMSESFQERLDELRDR